MCSTGLTLTPCCFEIPVSRVRIVQYISNKTACLLAARGELMYTRAQNAVRVALLTEPLLCCYATKIRTAVLLIGCLRSPTSISSWKKKNTIETDECHIAQFQPTHEKIGVIKLQNDT